MFDSLIQGAIAQRIFPGAVILLAQAGKILHFESYGTTMYEDAGSQAVQRDTIYDIASLTKVFTASAILRLVDAGKIRLDDLASRYLPELRARDVTIWHLLTHTSGLDIRLSTYREQGAEALLAASFGATQLQPAGLKTAYTNVNSLLLGEIITRICKVPLRQALQSLVIEPLDLAETDFNPDPSLLPRIAPTERDETWRKMLVHGKVHDESTFALGGIAGHAGLFSTAGDLLRFCQVWLDLLHNPPTQPFISPDLARYACTNHTMQLSLGCGLGWMMNRESFMGPLAATAFGHTGFTGPAIIIEPENQKICVFLTNRVYPYRAPAMHHQIIAAISEGLHNY
jgi:CubicO group peptidase (beta-lactamase class C family)